VKSITVRDLRHHWPQAEASLDIENEIVITRDSKPVAKLVKISAAESQRPRWNAAEHAQWQRAVAGGKMSGSTERLAKGRGDRTLVSRRK